MWNYQAFSSEFRHLMDHTVREIQHTDTAVRTLGVTHTHTISKCVITEKRRPKCGLPVFSTDVRHDVLVEELEDERDAVGKYQMLGHVLKLGRTIKTQSLAHLINLSFIKHYAKHSDQACASEMSLIM